jgi:hypothetical protein
MYMLEKGHARIRKNEKKNKEINEKLYFFNLLNDAICRFRFLLFFNCFLLSLKISLFFN